VLCVCGWHFPTFLHGEFIGFVLTRHYLFCSSKIAGIFLKKRTVIYSGGKGWVARIASENKKDDWGPAEAKRKNWRRNSNCDHFQVHSSFNIFVYAQFQLSRIAWREVKGLVDCVATQKYSNAQCFALSACTFPCTGGMVRLFDLATKKCALLYGCSRWFFLLLDLIYTGNLFGNKIITKS